MPSQDNAGRLSGGELPSPVARSDEHARRTFAEAHDSALRTYGDEERAHRVAYAALKHTYEKVGDHWEPKAHPGPSDAQAQGNAGTRRATAGGVDAHASKAHLYSLARRLDIPGRSRMTKAQLVEALQAESERANARARR